MDPQIENQQQQNSLASRILQALNKPVGQQVSTDPHFIVRLMMNITEILSSESDFPKQTNNLLSKSDFAIKLLQSNQFYEILAAHIGGELDGWGAASTLVFTSIQVLHLILTSTTPSDGRCKAAFLFFVDCGGCGNEKATANNKKNGGGGGALKVLYRLLTIASSCPSALVQQMSHPPPSQQVVTHSTSFSLQIEGEVFAWKCAWECIVGFVTAIGAREGRLFLQTKSEDIARLKALRQGAAVYVAYVKRQEEESGKKNVNGKVLLSVAKEFVEMKS